MKILTYDYKPFGDSLSFDKDLPRQAFGSEERDEEMGYYQMGRRLYDPAIGRFMAVDPLFESFPSQSPYNYAFNSPLQWRDPTGMAPQKERKRDRVQSNLFDQSELMMGVSFIERMRTAEAEAEHYARMFYADIGYESYLSCISSIGDAGGESDRRGESNENAANNGLKFQLNDEIKDRIKQNFTFNYNCDNEAPVSLKEQFFDVLFDSYGDEISLEDYEFLTSTEHNVNLYEENEWMSYINTLKEDNRDGIAYTNGHDFHFQTKMFTDVNFNFGKYFTEGIYYDEQMGNINIAIMHEVGHSFAYYKNGEEYRSWHTNYRENWAYWYSNTRYNDRMGLQRRRYDGRGLLDWIPNIFRNGKMP